MTCAQPHVGRYDPVTHTLRISLEHDKPARELAVGIEGRHKAVLRSGLIDAQKHGLPPAPPEEHRGHVRRREDVGAYNPMTHTLTFKGADNANHTVDVGAEGRLQAVLHSGHTPADTRAIDQLQSWEARQAALPLPTGKFEKAAVTHRPPDTPPRAGGKTIAPCKTAYNIVTNERGDDGDGGIAPRSSAPARAAAANAFPGCGGALPQQRHGKRSAKPASSDPFAPNPVTLQPDPRMSAAVLADNAKNLKPGRYKIDGGSVLNSPLKR